MDNLRCDGGVKFNQGQRFADYVQFLNENIPDQGCVVLLPGDVRPKELGSTPYMQFFLMPRQVINCESVACIKRVSRKNTYILVVGDFPDTSISSQSLEPVMFDGEWGVLTPPDFLSS